MDPPLVKQFQDAIRDIEQLSADDILNLIRDTIKVLRELQIRVASTNPEERERALTDAREIRYGLETQGILLETLVGLDPEQLAKFVESISNFPSDEWDASETAHRELAEFEILLRNALGSPDDTKSANKTLSHHKGWISG